MAGSCAQSSTIPRHLAQRGLRGRFVHPTNLAGRHCRIAGRPVYGEGSSTERFRSLFHDTVCGEGSSTERLLSPFTREFAYHRCGAPSGRDTSVPGCEVSFRHYAGRLLARTRRQLSFRGMSWAQRVRDVPLMFRLVQVRAHTNLTGRLCGVAGRPVCSESSSTGEVRTLLLVILRTTIRVRKASRSFFYGGRLASDSYLYGRG